MKPDINHAYLDEFAGRVMRKQLKLNSDGYDSGNKNANQAIVTPMVGCGGVCVCQESGVRRSVLCWCFWQRAGFSRREDVFTFNLLCNEMFCVLYFQFYLLNNATINCVTV
jgi:hypothetical protein